MTTQLMDKVAQFIESGSTDPDEFNALALEVFAYQYEHIEVVGRFADLANKTPNNITQWQDIPATPAAAFKQHDLFAGDRSDVVHTFESSGTTGTRLKSQALYSQRGLELMETAIVVNAQRMFLEDGRATRKQQRSQSNIPTGSRVKSLSAMGHLVLGKG